MRYNKSMKQYREQNQHIRSHDLASSFDKKKVIEKVYIIIIIMDPFQSSVSGIQLHGIK